MKRAGLYTRVSTLDQNPETQLLDLRQFAAQRGARGRRNLHRPRSKRNEGTPPRAGQNDGGCSAAQVRCRRCVGLRQAGEVNETSAANTRRTQRLRYPVPFATRTIDTEGPLGRAIIVIVSAIAELERSLIIERVRSGMRRARLEGRQIGRVRLDVDRMALVADRRDGMSLSQIAKKRCISKASVCPLLKECNETQPKALPSIEDLELRAGL